MIWYPPSDKDLTQLEEAGGPEWASSRVRDSLAEVTKWVRPEAPRWLSEACKRFLAAGNLGAFGDFRPHPFCRMTEMGRRRTASDLIGESDTCLRLDRRTGFVTRIHFHNSRATGVEVRTDETKAVERWTANVAVIVCAGAISTPALLIKSGVGPRAVLADQKTEPVLFNESIGEHFVDHLLMPIIFSTADQTPFPSSALSSKREIDSDPLIGPISSNLAECGGTFVLKHDGSDFESQIHLTPTHYLLYPQERAPAAMTLGVNLCNPLSRGNIQLENGNIHINPAYLSERQDMERMILAVDFARSLFKHSKLAEYATEELIPGSSRKGREMIERAIRRYSQTLYHPTSTCRMGRDKSTSVVDEHLSVTGLTGLHIIDASVLPSVPSVNPNATVMATAFHAARMLSDRYDS